MSSWLGGSFLGGGAEEEAKTGEDRGAVVVPRKEEGQEGGTTADLDTLKASIQQLLDLCAEYVLYCR